jgi:alkanesulfonate monooxygenase SsuD/methylene tetrahydromethanopterin reductase-like flavin-dependent oxidoreductase (luciferase family)
VDIDIILDPDITPAAMAEVAVEAERVGIRALWASNYHQHRDGFLSLVPAAMATSRILLGPLAVSPWEMHPLKMANALLTLNEISNGRAMVAVSGGGGVLSAIGWKADRSMKAWPGHDPLKGTRRPDRRVRAVRECIEVLDLARSGQMVMNYPGNVFEINRPFQMKWTKRSGPLLYGCCCGPQMIRMGTRVADAIQFSDFTVAMMPQAMEKIRAGLTNRDAPAEKFRIGNFWAWHIKADREAAMWEARKELIWRGAIIGQDDKQIRPFCHNETELKLVLDNWQNFRKAHWTNSGDIEGVPQDLVKRLIAGMSSAGDLSMLESELERFRQFSKSGLTELALRLHAGPMESLKIIGDHVIPALR